ncbi:MAG: filamentous hemagglutinin N-terminal domain-containing protein [Gloeotrichia echinulata DEX184]|nr:filamentous hemagglutinin N-terminal domain-containing protein [Gloeotrichia echinulata DEX184]
MSNFWVWFKSLGIAICCPIAFCANSAIAQITQDGTLPTNSQVTPQGNIINIEGGTQVGSNLFHSFKEFSVPAGSTAYFKNTENIQNIISRVTGKSISDIQGILKADGTANLFLINPNGIVFGPNASLQIGGSFLATTASSLNFADGTKFSATDPQTRPLLTVSVPIGLQFGATAATIINQSQAKSPDGVTNSLGSPVGLQVQPDKTLALVGGDIMLEGGNLTVASGRIELGSVAANSLVTLNPNNQGWVLRYEKVQDFQNIRFIQRGSDDGSQVPSQVEASNKDSNVGNIQVRGNTVELTGDNVILSTQTTGAKDGGDLTINTSKLILRDGATISTNTRGRGNGGKLTVNATDFVEIIGSYFNKDNTVSPSVLSSTSFVAGNGGEININTGRLRLQDGGRIATDSTGIFSNNSEFIAGIGAGGNLTVNASKSVELIGTSIYTPNVTSGLFARTYTSGDAGKVTITTGELIVRDKSTISVSSARSVFFKNVPTLGKAGALNITAGSILLDNQGTLTSNSDLGQGGNINLQVQEFLRMRGNSQITTNAGTAQAPGDGGNITINAPNGFIIAEPLGNNDITANAFYGSGGKITINANQIFGFVVRTRADLERLLGTQDPDKLKPSNLPSSDITAFSQQNPSLNGTIQINTPDVDPSKGLVEIRENVVDISQQILPICRSLGKLYMGSFVITGRGGIAAGPSEPLTADAVLADWITLEGENRAGDINDKVAIQQPSKIENTSPKNNSVNPPTEIVEAQGWVLDSNGNVVLVTQAATVTPHSPAMNTASCPVAYN